MDASPEAVAHVDPDTQAEPLVDAEADPEPHLDAEPEAVAHEDAPAQRAVRHADADPVASDRDPELANGHTQPANGDTLDPYGDAESPDEHTVHAVHAVLNTEQAELDPVDNAPGLAPEQCQAEQDRDDQVGDASSRGSVRPSDVRGPRLNRWPHPVGCARRGRSPRYWRGGALVPSASSTTRRVSRRRVARYPLR